jgi:hypothetical protein
MSFSNSVLFFTGHWVSFSPGACIVSRVLHVSSEFEKESDSGMSVASDSTRDDPCNRYLVTTAPGMILYIKLSIHQQRTDTLEYQLSAYPVRRSKNNVNALSIISRNIV